MKPASCLLALAALASLLTGSAAPDPCKIGGLFPDKNISPEMVFITNKQSRGKFLNQAEERCTIEVAEEFRFNLTDVTLGELEQNGFNRRAPVTFIMHGFTSGYPLQAWISAIVEAYTINRSASSQKGQPVDHNLFIINWQYAARGWNYARAVMNIPKVAEFATKFIDEKLFGEAQIDPSRIQLIGHSLGAHLAGSIGKSVSHKLGRIYGLDPAGPCFGTVSEKMVDLKRRLGPSDAEEVITIHTNTAKLGIDATLGQYSVFVEGGADQPGCHDNSKGKDIINTVFMKADDTPSCSHGRAPNLFTHLIDQSNRQDDCQMIAYECKDWESYEKGHCGICYSHAVRGLYATEATTSHTPDSAVPAPVDCIRVGLNWQYPEAKPKESWNYQADELPGAAAVAAKRVYMRTSDTQPFCTYNYQVVLELNEPFQDEKTPSMSLVLQDSILSQQGGERKVPNSLNVDSFGNKHSDLAYTQLVSSTKKLRRIYHATLLIRSGLRDGQRVIKYLHINYMSHADPTVRAQLSSKLCLLETNMHRHSDDEAHNRYFFELCPDQTPPPGAHDEL